MRYVTVANAIITRKKSGYAHCRGVRIIVINSTFTAGGLSAPIFLAVYGLSRSEMPKDDIITRAVPGLIAGSAQNLYSSGEGFVTFVCGAESKDENEHNMDEDTIDQAVEESYKSTNTSHVANNTYSPKNHR